MIWKKGEVNVITTIKSDSTDFIILGIQYRLAVDKYCI